MKSSFFGEKDGSAAESIIPLPLSWKGYTFSHIKYPDYFAFCITSHEFGYQQWERENMRHQDPTLMGVADYEHGLCEKAATDCVVAEAG